MIVVVNQNAYEMPHENAELCLCLAGSLVPMGIYAVEDDGYIELKNEVYDTYHELANAVTGYRMKGFRVHYNDGSAR